MQELFWLRQSGNAYAGRLVRIVERVEIAGRDIVTWALVNHDGATISGACLFSDLEAAQ